MSNIINIKADCEHFSRIASCLKVFNICILAFALFLALPACSGSSGPTTSANDNGDNGNDDNNQGGDDNQTTDPVDQTGTGIVFDTDFATPGLQVSDSIKNPGAGNKIGFAVYIQNVTDIGGFSITLTWDGGMAEFRESSSGPAITDEVMDINGAADVVFSQESNLLQAGSTQLISIKNENIPGSYGISYAQMGGTQPVSTTGVLYQAVYRIAKSGAFDINVDVKIADSDGKETDLPRKVFHVLE